MTVHCNCITCKYNSESKEFLEKLKRGITYTSMGECSKGSLLVLDQDTSDGVDLPVCKNYENVLGVF